MKKTASDPLPVKKDLRQRLRKLVADMPPDAQERKSQQAGHLLFETDEFRKAEVVMVFLSLPGEIDTSAVVLRAWQLRKRVLAPKVSWNQRRMMPIEIRSLTEDLLISDMGIREPAAGIPFPISLIDLVLVPGLGFDEYGNRLGRGRGFYDRFLAHPEFQGVSCAMAFEEQLLPSIPVGPLDRKVNMLITDTQVRRFK